MKPNPLDFWTKYELVASSKNYFQPDVKIDKCRYCGLTNTQTEFTQNTHLLPELIGENDILTFDECDKCNRLFSNFESNFSIFIRPYITLMGVKGKKKIPTFQSRTEERDEYTRTVLRHAEGNRKELLIQTLDDYRINPEAKTFDIIFRKPPFVPLKVYRTLLKIGLSLLPKTSDDANKQSFAWLTDRQEHLEFIPFAFTTSLSRTSFVRPFADLYRAKQLVNGNSEFPEHTLILCFANQIIQIFLPFSDELKEIHNGKRQLSLDLYPAFAFDKIEKPKTVEVKYYDLSVATSVTENHQISFSYEVAEINIPRNK